jgi:organic hydroperoxide reductase OsmC/OhrA
VSGTRKHRYSVTAQWTGNLGSGTSNYGAYSRDHEIGSQGKQNIQGSSDPAFRGDRSRWNPEELLVASLSTCHMLWYLHLAAAKGIVVTAYTDQPEGTMEEQSDGSGRLTLVVLRPTVTIIDTGDTDRADTLHHVAHEKCFIANSVNFPVTCEPKKIVVAG